MHLGEVQVHRRFHRGFSFCQIGFSQQKFFAAEDHAASYDLSLQSVTSSRGHRYRGFRQGGGYRIRPPVSLSAMRQSDEDWPLAMLSDACSWLAFIRIYTQNKMDFLLSRRVPALLAGSRRVEPNCIHQQFRS